MELITSLAGELRTVLGTVLSAAPFIIGYVLLILGTLAVWKVIRQFLQPRRDYSALKTVTFGDESAVTSNTVASVISIALIFVLWGAFTGSKLLPGFLHVPGAFTGEGSFTYTAQGPDGSTDEATVMVRVFPAGSEADAPEAALGEGFAKDDGLAVQAYRSELLRFDDNDEFTRDDGASVVAIDGRPVEAGGPGVDVGFATVNVTGRGTLNITPDTGWQMEPIWLPAPEAVWSQLVKISSDGFRNSTLAEHLGYSLFRVIVGFLLGAIVGIPLGYAMGLSDWFRGWFDPIVEFMRPVPPLALIPLVILWAGIGEVGKIILLFLAALWIMAIAARSGVSGVRISKVHAAYSLGASKWQIMRHVIIPNSLPDIFTGARVAMGVCWGTVVAAELVAAEKGAGMMIMVASKFQSTDIVIMGIILIGVVGFSIDMLMRWAERILVPWKGRG
ncbi:ABC transporter permease [Flavimaricola marinus]|uniref:Putative aliphatic sulfonates transport permease protein SsuC n=1 Tax=Flavimaricola marinus TaxID=1819565 RepID=A0A238LCP6_9RHOB|nr:ABC transporter permease subunit [Flavimaricola marinus]SMY06690.1 Putative aliphatic sulfonates transport permease protein SsuC [Flavimaricola marinus]